MHKVITISLFALAFISGFVVLYNLNTIAYPTQNKSDSPNESDTPDAIQTWESKIDDQASVTVTVTPVDVGVESEKWKFHIVMSTHSVELDQDMMSVAVLVDDVGREYGPVRWEGAPPGGHHRDGVLTFNQILPVPKSLELTITDIGDSMRSFIWPL
ncbi:MAG: hypothetical protein AAB343_03370 [Patescibacteria group bacterium]